MSETEILFKIRQWVAEERRKDDCSQWGEHGRLFAAMDVERILNGQPTMSERRFAAPKEP